jgi:hypothetical protein
MSKTIWNKGAPPSIGWWPASCDGDIKEIRWWDGEVWSFAAHPNQSAVDANHKSQQKNLIYSKDFKWSKRWWL